MSTLPIRPETLNEFMQNAADSAEKIQSLQAQLKAATQRAERAEAELQRMREGVETIAADTARHAETLQQSAITWPGYSITIDGAIGTVNELRDALASLLTPNTEPDQEATDGNRD